jgi:hypothetical protein
MRSAWQNWYCMDRYKPPRFSETTIGQRIITRASTPLRRFKMFLGAILHGNKRHSDAICRNEGCRVVWRKGTMLWPELRIFGLILYSRIVDLIVQIGSEYQNWQPYYPFLSNMHRFASCACFQLFAWSLQNSKDLDVSQSLLRLYAIIPMPIGDELLKPPQH